MDNPFKLILYIWRSRRPSKLRDMTAQRNSFWLRKNYAALTFFGTIITGKKETADQLNRESSSLKTHEMIHLRQAQSLHDSWMLFYLRYLWYYIRGLHLNRKMRNAAYKTNPFEMEAYRHEHDNSYLSECKNGANEWRRYAKMSPKERLKEYKNPTISSL